MLSHLTVNMIDELALVVGGGVSRPSGMFGAFEAAFRSLGSFV